MKSKLLSVAAVCLLLPSVAQAKQLQFEDVVRNLRNPDAKTRLSALRVLRDARYPEAIEPIAALVNDPVEAIQLEAIATELSFFLGRDVKTKKMVGFVVEKRNPVIAAAAFDAGPAVVWPHPVPPALVAALLKAVDDDDARVRLEAMYTVGVIARPPLAADQVQPLIKALDHYDPSVRAAAAKVIGRLKMAEASDALMKAVNDSHADVRYAAMRAVGAIRDTRAVAALSEQLAFYKKGEGAWSALDALAQIGAPTSVPLFKERLSDKDPYVRRAAAEGLGRAGDTSAVDVLERNVTADDSPMARMAAAFALQKLGRNYTGRIADVATTPVLAAQAVDYFIELGPSVAPALYARLQDPEPTIRAAAADALGMIGGAAALPVLDAAAKDREPIVADAAQRAIARIKFAAAAPARGK